MRTLQCRRAACALTAAAAVLLLETAAWRANAAPAPALIPAPGAGPVSVEDAQARADFVIYLPTYLPRGASKARLFFAPEQDLPDVYVPSRVYANYGQGISLWQMPALGRPLVHPGRPLSMGGKLGWMSSGPGRNAFTIEWQQGETQLGLAGPLAMQDEVLKMVGSAAQAAPLVSPASVSPAQLRNWAPQSAPQLSPGGIGISLAPGTPPMVLSLDPGAPAAQAGIEPGDIITAVEGQGMAGHPVTQILSLIRGEPGTVVRLTVQRHGRPAPLQLSLRRAKLTVTDAREVTLAQARSMMPFAVLQPQWLPPGYGLVTCTAILEEGKPVEARLLYTAAGWPPVVISETGAGSGRIVMPADGETQRVNIGGVIGALSIGAGLALSWTQGGTSVLIQSRSLPVRRALGIARSMR
jgi:hypothetical protein